MPVWNFFRSVSFKCTIRRDFSVFASEESAQHFASHAQYRMEKCETKGYKEYKTTNPLYPNQAYDNQSTNLSAASRDTKS